jgi:hypothetical protein
MSPCQNWCCHGVFSLPCVRQINAFIILLLVQKMVYYYKLRNNNMIVVDYLEVGVK